MTYYDYGAEVVQAAATISSDMINQVPNHAEKLLEEARGLSGVNVEKFKIDPVPPKKVGTYMSNYDWEAYEAAVQEQGDVLLEAFKKKVGDGVDLYIFEFSDNDGDFFCVLEHGGTFDNVDH